MPITLGNTSVAAKISNAIVEGSASDSKLRSLLQRFSPQERLKIATEVVKTVGNASGDSAQELRGLASRLNDFGAFVLEGRNDFFPHTHHSFWMDAGDNLEREANLLEGRSPDEGVSAT